MKIGIIGDTHFGAGYNLGKTDPDTQFNSRLLDFVNTFNNIVDEFVKRKVGLIVLTGDIFETRHPTNAQLNAFSKCIQRAINRDIDIVIVVGNHDQQRTISTTTVDIYSSLETPGISIYADMGIHTVKDEYGNNVNFVLMPYRDRRMVGTKTNREAIDSIRTKLNGLCMGLTSPQIVVGHFMVDKSITGENPDSFSINELILPLSMFSDFDLVIMGHVHQHAILSKKNPPIIYSGSMEKVSFGEKHHRKVSLVLDTNNIQNVEIIKSKVRKLHDMNFNYAEQDECYKSQITEKIILDIEKFNMKYNLKDSISKFSAKVKEDDLCHVNHDKIREFLLSKKVKHLMPIHVSAISSRQLRNRKITENVSGKRAMSTYIKSLIEPEAVKKQLVKAAYSIIEEVEGK